MFTLQRDDEERNATVRFSSLFLSLSLRSAEETEKKNLFRMGSHVVVEV